MREVTTIFITRLLLRLSACLPLSINHALGTLLGMLMNQIPIRERYYTRRNIELCLPLLSKGERRTLTRKSLIETGKNLTELGPLWYWSRHKVDSMIRSIDGESVLQQAQNQGKGVIFALPHLGSWELAALHLSTLHKTTTLYRPPNLQSAEKQMCNARERFGATLVPTSSSGVRALFRSIAAEEQIIILPDQDPGAGAGVFAPFFGIKVNTMVLLSRLAAKSGAPVVFCYAERLAGGKGYQICYRPAPDPINDKNIEVSATAMNTGIENCVRLLPEQYQWSYKRFKYRPEGAEKLYR